MNRRKINQKKPCALPFSADGVQGFFILPVLPVFYSKCDVIRLIAIGRPVRRDSIFSHSSRVCALPPRYRPKVVAGTPVESGILASVEPE